MKLIEQYRRNILKKHSRKPRISLFDYIVGVFTGQFDDTDTDSNHSNEMSHWEDDADLWAGSDEITDDVSTTLKKNESFDYKANTP